MSRHYQESEIEFERVTPGMIDYPVSRSIVVRQYGGSMEECVAKARAEFGLSQSDWSLIKVLKAGQ